MPQSKSSVDLLLMASSYLVIISANHKAYTPKELQRANDHLVSDLNSQGHYWKRVQGCYKGHVEPSYIVSCNDVFDLLQLQQLGHKYLQECVLILDQVAREALLNYSDDMTTIIGRELVQVDKALAETRCDYSIIDGDYWVVTS